MSNRTAPVIPGGIISDEVYNLLGFIIQLVINPSLGIVGICSNFINIVTFLKIGLSDGVTQNFFILSVSDGLSSIIVFISSLSYILQQTIFAGVQRVELQLQALYWACYYSATFPQSISVLTTVVIAVVRCCCVAMPFKVRYFLTAKRQLVAILVASGATIGLLLFTFSPMKTVHLRNPQTNRLFAVLVGYRWATYTAFAGSLLYASFILVIVCVIILSISLNRSSKFRESSASNSASSESDKRKDTRVVKTVVLVSVVFIICFSPPSIFSIMKAFIGNFSLQGRYRKESRLFLMFIETFYLINANMNIYIYLLCNTRYRNTFKALFGKADSSGSKKV
ncbi:chemosensory receptor A [Elysia marginata]|uniref:Chemosensory receptor A n=1 Tax=Elysia marginata TaxID=1093978 RepID=A0AAV4JBV7_9GAST|nr:chemosensory receptor A [Elysia marginata]